MGLRFEKLKICFLQLCHSITQIKLALYIFNSSPFSTKATSATTGRPVSNVEKLLLYTSSVTAHRPICSEETALFVYM